MREPLRAACSLSLREVVEAVGGRTSAPASALDFTLGGVATDSRDLSPGDLFVARRGAAQDGHRFLGAALAAGASALLVETPPEGEVPVPVVIVPDATIALGALGRAWRRRLGLRLVAVTGSNGKTTTKEMIAAILAAHAGGRESVLVTPGNWNNHVGLPLTLLGGTPGQRLGVVELGMNAPGEIDALTAIAEPEVGVITNAARAHLERFGGAVEGVAQAKSELWHRMGEEAVAVVNLDDPRLASLALGRRGPRVTFGQAEGADVRLLAVESDRALRVRLRFFGTELPVELPLFGRHNAWNLAAAAAAAHALGVPAETIRTGLAATRLPAHRAALTTVGGVVVLDDCYNANPDSVRAAAQSLVDLGGAGRLGAVLGEMRELGATAHALHREVGRHLGELGYAVIIGLGPLCEALCDGARQGGAADALHVATTAEAARAAAGRFAPGDRVLVKGSRALGMEAVITDWRAHADAMGRA